MEYKDGLGHVYDVSDKYVSEFEQRRTKLLIAAIAIKLVVLSFLLYWSWSR